MAVYYAKEIACAHAENNNSGLDSSAWDDAWVQGSNNYLYRSFLRYDLTKIPYKSNIVSAKLKIYEWWKNDNGDNGTTNIARVTEDWTESGVNWGNQPESTGRYLTEDVSPPGVGNWTDWDITTLVQEWIDREHPNYGLQILNNNEGAYRIDWRFYNRRHGSGQYATYIEIEYEPEEEYRITRARMEEIAGAIREKTGDTGKYSPAQIKTAVETANLEFAVNIAYGNDAPEDTTKLWVKSNRPNSVAVRTEIEPEISKIETLSTTLPHQLYAMGYATVGSVIYLFGGSATGGTRSNAIFAFDTATEMIRKLDAVLPYACDSVSAAVVGSKVYLFGGFLANGTLSTIHVFDAETETIKTLSTTLPKPHAGCAAASVGSKIYLFGNAGAGDVNTIEVFDTDAETIQVLSTTMPDNRSYANAIAVGNHIYIVNGRTDETYSFDTVIIFDTDTETIRTAYNKLVVSQRNPASIRIGSKIYMFGGYIDGTAVDSICTFDIVAENSRLESDVIPLANARAGIGFAGSNVYLFGGLKDLSGSIIRCNINATLDDGTLAIHVGSGGRKVRLVDNTALNVEVGVVAAYIGNESNDADIVDACVYDTKSAAWVSI